MAGNNYQQTTEHRNGSEGHLIVSIREVNGERPFWCLAAGLPPGLSRGKGKMNHCV